jgi:hypothetical protein
MAVTAFLYSQVTEGAFNDEIDLDTDTIKVALLTGYTPDQDAHDFFSDVSASEVAATGGYTAGGATLSNKTVGMSGKVFTFDNTADTVWSTSTISATHAVIYVDTGNAATSRLIACINFGGTVSSTAGNFTIAWHASGIFTFTVA